MRDLDDFLTTTLGRQVEAEEALHNGDPGPRLAMWSATDPVTVLGAVRSATGWDEVSQLFRSLGSHFSDCTSYRFELVAADISGDLAYTVGYEHTSVSWDGTPGAVHPARHPRLSPRRWRVEDRPPPCRRPLGRPEPSGPGLDGATVTPLGCRRAGRRHGGPIWLECRQLPLRGRRGTAADQGGRHAQDCGDRTGLGIPSDPSGEGPSRRERARGPTPGRDQAGVAGRRVLELRIHGVANTPPEGTLGVRQVRRMDGDQHTGFYRPVDERAPEPVVTEAYSWGSLTSASRSLNQDGTTVGVRKDLVRALWMLLLPFAFANVAFWTRLRTAGPGGAEQWGERGERPLDLGGSAAWFQRVLCLGVTATFALAAVGAGVDLVGWQCETRECLSKLPFLGFLEVRPAGEGGGRWGPACWLSGSWPRSPPCWSCGGWPGTRSSTRPRCRSGSGPTSRA